MPTARACLPTRLIDMRIHTVRSDTSTQFVFTFIKTEVQSKKLNSRCENPFQPALIDAMFLLHTFKLDMMTDMLNKGEK